jgi:hypothetical protein
VPAEIIDDAALLEAARFTDANGLWFNGLIEEPTNMADWIAEVLPYFLLRESRVGGKRGLRPLLPTIAATGAINTGPVPAVRSFTDDDVIPGSVEITYISRQERLPFTVQVLWRQQPTDGLGLARTSNVRYGGSALDGPFEQHDISAYGTSETHAYKVGAYILARRRYIEHRMTLQVLPGDIRNIRSQGDIVRVTLSRQANIGDSVPLDFLYEVDRVARTPDGEIQLELTHFPVDELGRSLVARDVEEAEGPGVQLPTGRAAVNCDINSPSDTSVPPDFGPWPGWDFDLELDFPIFKIDLELEWPDGIEVDAGSGWGPGGVGVESQANRWSWDRNLNGVGGWIRADDAPPTPGWQWNQTTQTWVPDGGVGQTPPPLLPPAEPAEDSAPVDVTIGFTEPYIVYPEVFYSSLGPNYADVYFAVTASPAPAANTAPYQIRVTDGTLTPIETVGDRELGGTQTQFDAMLNEGQERSPELIIPGVMDPPDLGFFQSTARTLTTMRMRVRNPEVTYTGERYPEVTYTTQEQDYEIAPYVGELTWGDPGAWLRDDNQWEWDTEFSLPSGWTWSVTNQQWTSTSTVADWTWDAPNNRWIYTGSTSPRPGQPALPPAIPDSLPISGLRTFTVQVSIDKMPVVDDLVVRINSGGPEGLLKTVNIPPVSALWGDWRWVSATEEWERRGSTGDWRWHSQQKAWQWLGTGAAPTGTEPTQGGSIYPPDASTWTWDGSAWVGGVYAQNGNAPVGFWGGNATIHVPRTVETVSVGTTNGGYSIIKLFPVFRLPTNRFVLTFNAMDGSNVSDTSWQPYYNEYKRLLDDPGELPRKHVEVQIIPSGGEGDPYIIPVANDGTWIFDTMTKGSPLQQSFKDLIDTLRPTEVYFYGDISGSTVPGDWDLAISEMKAYLESTVNGAVFVAYAFPSEIYFTGAPGPGFPTPKGVGEPERVL